MKKFVMSAYLLTDLTTAVDMLTPQQTAEVFAGLKPSAANRKLSKLLKKMKKGLNPHYEELQRLAAERNAIVDAYQKKYNELGDGVPEEQKKETGADYTTKMHAEVREIDKTSKLDEYKDQPIEVTLADEELDDLVNVLDASVNFWVGPKGESFRERFVEAADILDNAVEA
jgi:hypothetical protein